MAGNQLGKTFSGGNEAAIHATGLYPGWWKGFKFNKPTVGWAAGVTGESTRDTVQRILLGRPGEFGTGSIPKESIVDYTMARGVADLVDTIRVKHVSGGTSTISFKSYEKGRDKWQGETLDWVWFDEEPPEDIYTEGLTRTNATGGIVWITFTPLKGMSEVVSRFLVKGHGKVIQMTIDDAEHYTPEQRAKIIASYAEYERDARTKGAPTLGSGRVFPVEDSLLSEPAIQISEHWPRIAGLDLGDDHPTAVVWMAWDRDTDTVHIYDCYRKTREVIAVHASAIKAKGAWIPTAWPHDANKRDGAQTGLQYKVLYANEGVNMLPMHAQTSEGLNSVEPAVDDMLTRMKTGRLKVASHLNDWWEEFRLYHRKDGLIVKERDDLMSATRYGVMMLRFAETDPSRNKGQARPGYQGQGSWMR